ncbi:MAG: tRNA (adenosine(37)-N6)-threonylcarbamoyltransferase complex transferase subunit TsaD [Pseudomonadota bacterium]
MNILGIETSCDETAAAVIQLDGDDRRVLSNIVFSQIEEHAAFGGVVPELAARAHVTRLDKIVEAAMVDAAMNYQALTAIAATTGPGLIGSLIVGAMTGRAIAQAAGKPFVPINHLEGHALTARLTDGVAFPYLLLLVSGGHTQIICVRGVGQYERWASTIDDALGEAFDKTAKLLGLPYPGGPAVEQAAATGDQNRFKLPRPLRGEERLDFSFSGLKSALRKTATELGTLNDHDVADLCASFQLAVTETLHERVGRALQKFQHTADDKNPTLVVAGGVAANNAIRGMLTDLCNERRFSFIAPPLNLCTDNAAMIAWAAAERIQKGLPNDVDPEPRPRWPLDEASAPMMGSGKRGAKV